MLIIRITYTHTQENSRLQTIIINDIKFIIITVFIHDVCFVEHDRKHFGLYGPN